MPEIDNLHDIEIFLEAVRTGSFTEAARAFGISQPTISHAVKRLERTLGTVLFERQSFGTGGIRLTRSGHIFEAHAERIVEELRKARRTIDDLEGRRTIYLGIPPILLSRFYKGAIVTLQRTYHKNKFVVQSLGSSRTLHEISRHALDAGVVACTGSFPTIPNVRARKVGSFPF
ncbi:LysR family transcriptional regulator [Olsenella profusa]|uniref:Transcriptional regulator, LysR family n=1 Tax=Olsenella profusa F0195 TaxID=1125712 RepID=U2TRN3_9ACTN|nr:LysR family transcriptional regulator [Olsenella profusa]ERL08743.1 transcriptional regulator, LysR family [Olsenella profusa F0195]